MRRFPVTLGERLGVAVHVSPLRFRLEQRRGAWPSATAVCLEDWLVDVANARGARVVERPNAPAGFAAPPREALSNEDLAAGLCQLQCLDRPQMIRLAAQLISRGAVDVPRLALVARRERLERVLAALAKAALRVEPQHAVWREIARLCADGPPLRDVILHWTRLAEPVMAPGRPNPIAWRLVA